MRHQILTKPQSKREGAEMPQNESVEKDERESHSTESLPKRNRPRRLPHAEREDDLV